MSEAVFTINIWNKLGPFSVEEETICEDELITDLLKELLSLQSMHQFEQLGNINEYMSVLYENIEFPRIVQRSTFVQGVFNKIMKVALIKRKEASIL